MTIQVTFCFSGHGVQVRTFPATSVPKVLASGILKISKAAEFEVPPMGKKDEEIVTKPEVVLAIFNGEYIVERI